MKVREFIAKLQEQDQEAEVMFSGYIHDMREEVDGPGTTYDIVEEIRKGSVNIAHSAVWVHLSIDAWP